MHPATRLVVALALPIVLVGCGESVKLNVTYVDYPERTLPSGVDRIAIARINLRTEWDFEENMEKLASSMLTTAIHESSKILGNPIEVLDREVYEGEAGTTGLPGSGQHKHMDVVRQNEASTVNVVVHTDLVIHATKRMKRDLGATVLNSVASRATRGYVNKVKDEYDVIGEAEVTCTMKLVDQATGTELAKHIGMTVRSEEKLDDAPVSYNFVHAYTPNGKLIESLIAPEIHAFVSEFLPVERSTVVKVESSSHDASMMGVKYLEGRDYELAASEFKVAIAEDPTDDRSHFGLAIAYELMGKYDLASDACQSALQLDYDEDYLDTRDRLKARSFVPDYVIAAATKQQPGTHDPNQIPAKPSKMDIERGSGSGANGQQNAQQTNSAHSSPAPVPQQPTVSANSGAFSVTIDGQGPTADSAITNAQENAVAAYLRAAPVDVQKLWTSHRYETLLKSIMKARAEDYVRVERYPKPAHQGVNALWHTTAVATIDHADFTTKFNESASYLKESGEPVLFVIIDDRFAIDTHTPVQDDNSIVETTFIRLLKEAGFTKVRHPGQVDSNIQAQMRRANLEDDVTKLQALADRNQFQLMIRGYATATGPRVDHVSGATHYTYGCDATFQAYWAESANYADADSTPEVLQSSTIKGRPGAKKALQLASHWVGERMVRRILKLVGRASQHGGELKLTIKDVASNKDLNKVIDFIENVAGVQLVEVESFSPEFKTPEAILMIQTTIKPRKLAAELEDQISDGPVTVTKSTLTMTFKGG